MLYYLYEMNHAALAPWRAAADAGLNFWTSAANPFAATPLGRNVAASLEMFERGTRRYSKPSFGIVDAIVGDSVVPVTELPVLNKPFCNLLHFRKAGAPPQNKLLIVAPLSGHYATLLRGTVESMLSHFDVYITDWIDARTVPTSKGSFDLDDYIDYMIEMPYSCSTERVRGASPPAEGSS